MINDSRVVVTGLGCVSALGYSVAEFWAALLNGRSGIGPITLVPHDAVQVTVAAEVPGYDERDHFDDRAIQTCDRYTQFALLAAREAIADAGFEASRGAARGDETAVIVASGVGGWTTIESAVRRLHGPEHARPHPLTIPRMMISAATSHICREFGLRGPAFTVSSACASSNHALGEAYWMIRSGRARAAVVGGAEAEIGITAQRGWESLRVLAPDTCRPFSRDRRGMVIGEGAAILILESLDDARRRGARIYCELAGYGLSADAGDIVAPDADGAARAMRQAMDTARLNPDEVEYINAHGTGTALNDATEVRAIRAVLGEAAYRVMVSSTKSMHGHALGATAAIEAVATVKAIAEGVVPPTVNYTTPDPECDLDHVPNVARARPVRVALSNSLAFGGLNAVVAFRAL